MEHYSSRYKGCERCGYSKFYYLGEFKNEDPSDKTKVCADCGHINGQSDRRAGPNE